MNALDSAVPLKEHILALMAERDKQVAIALAAADRAVVKAEAAAEKRFEGVNEFRATLSDQAARLMPREEAVTRMDSLRERLDALTLRITTTEGRSSGLAAGWGWIVGVVGLIGGILGIVLALKR